MWAHTEDSRSAGVQVEILEGEPGPRVDLQLVSLWYHVCYIHSVLVQSMDFTPKERPTYATPTPLPEGIEVCLVNTPLLQNISKALTSVPYLPELLWIHDVVAPNAFNFSFTTTSLRVGCWASFTV